MTVDPDTYVAWDGMRYDGSPPSGWYLGADNRWWPSKDVPPEDRVGDPPPPRATDAIPPAKPPSPPAGTSPPAPRRPANGYNAAPAPTAWAPSPGGQPPPPDGPPIAVGAPTPQRRIKPIHVGAGALAVAFYFWGFGGGVDYAPLDDTSATTVWFGDETIETFEGLDEVTIEFDPTTTTLPPPDPNAFETAPPTTALTYLATDSNLTFEFFYCGDGFLEGLVYNTAGEPFAEISFTVLFASPDGGEVLSFPLALSRSEADASMYFGVQISEEIENLPDCRTEIIDVIVQ